MLEVKGGLEVSQVMGISIGCSLVGAYLIVLVNNSTAVKRMIQKGVLELEKRKSFQQSNIAVTTKVLNEMNPWITKLSRLALRLKSNEESIELYGYMQPLA